MKYASKKKRGSGANKNKKYASKGGNKNMKYKSKMGTNKNNKQKQEIYKVGQIKTNL